MKNIRLILFYSAFMVLGAAAIGTAANLPQQGAPKLPAAQQPQQQAVPAAALDTLQQAFSVTPQQPLSVNFHVTNPGTVTINATLTGAPVAIYLRTSAGTALASATVQQPSGRLTYNITAADLQKGYAFNIAMTSGGNASGNLAAAYPKVDRPKLDAWLAAQPKAAAARPAAPAVAAPKAPAAPIVSLPAVGGNWRPNLRAGKVALADGVNFNAQDFINLTSLRNHAKLKNFFTPDFQQKFLKAPVRYTEDVREDNDRLVITRSLEIPTKDPCAPGMEISGMSLCFKPRNEPISKESKEHLDKIRLKINNKLRANPGDPGANTYKSYLRMSDHQLLDQILNKQSTTKKITLQSIVPYTAYQFRMIPHMDILISMFRFRESTRPQNATRPLFRLQTPCECSTQRQGRLYLMPCARHEFRAPRIMVFMAKRLPGSQPDLVNSILKDATTICIPSP
jgi:hypothetical protein